MTDHVELKIPENGKWGSWKLKYAYFPRKINGEWVWFNYYYRREKWYVHVGGEFVEYQYLNYIN